MAKAYVDDEHTSVEGWIPDSPTWLYWFNVEYARVYRELLTHGLIGPNYTDYGITADGSDSYAIDVDVLAIASVHEDLGDGSVRYLAPLQPSAGRLAGHATTTGIATRWSARGIGGVVSIELRPVPTSGSFVVRLVEDAGNLTVSDSIELAAGMVDRVVLGMARRALIKEGSSSSALDAQLRAAEEDMVFMSASRTLGAAPGARKASYWQGALNQHGGNAFADPSTWWWYRR